MNNEHGSAVASLVGEAFPDGRGNAAMAVLEPMVDASRLSNGPVDATTFAVALNIVLFADLVERAPTGAAYVNDVRAAGRRVVFDHGAIRTIRMPGGQTGELPPGETAFRRLLEPLGYTEAAVYPLPSLRMTGRAYRHRLYPDTIPQFFVSELHVDRFDGEFVQVAERVFGSSVDPMDQKSRAALAWFAAGGMIGRSEAASALRRVVAAFGRHHDRPSLSDYEVLRRHSAEAAWIATEGNAFNHATDRVPDVEALAEVQRALGRPIKDRVEHSASGRVRQTAFRADHVLRSFGVSGSEETIPVPGSFYEFISRDVDPGTGALDLSFDSGNATGIFGMTKTA